jgi:hypothetical protein
MINITTKGQEEITSKLQEDYKKALERHKRSRATTIFKLPTREVEPQVEE